MSDPLDSLDPAAKQAARAAAQTARSQIAAIEPRVSEGELGHLSPSLAPVPAQGDADPYRARALAEDVFDRYRQHRSGPEVPAHMAEQEAGSQTENSVGSKSAYGDLKQQAIDTSSVFDRYRPAIAPDATPKQQRDHDRDR